MSVDNDKRELLKLKQGLIEESDAIDEGGYDVAMPDTAMGKFKNWLWYHKLWFIIGFIVLALGFVIWYFFFVSEKPDIRIYSTGNYSTTYRQLLEENTAAFCPDFDKDGKVKVSINQPGDDTVMGFTDLYAEIENGNSSLYIGKKDKLEALYNDFKTAKDKEIFASLKDITGADVYLIDVTKTQFGEDNKLLTTELFIAVKNTDDESEKQAIEFLSNLYNNKKFLRD